MHSRCIQIIKDLLSALPDSPHPGLDWDHCWLELDTESQDYVKLVRNAANTLLKELES